MFKDQYWLEPTWALFIVLFLCVWTLTLCTGHASVLQKHLCSYHKSVFLLVFVCGTSSAKGASGWIWAGLLLSCCCLSLNKPGCPGFIESASPCGHREPWVKTEGSGRTRGLNVDGSGVFMTSSHLELFCYNITLTFIIKEAWRRE